MLVAIGVFILLLKVVSIIFVILRFILNNTIMLLNKRITTWSGFVWGTSLFA